MIDWRFMCIHLSWVRYRVLILPHAVGIWLNFVKTNKMGWLHLSAPDLVWVAQTLSPRSAFEYPGVQLCMCRPMSNRSLTSVKCCQSKMRLECLIIVMSSFTAFVHAISIRRSPTHYFFHFSGINFSNKSLTSFWWLVKVTRKKPTLKWWFVWWIFFFDSLLVGRCVPLRSFNR